jgi:hypothetical protein
VAMQEAGIEVAAPDIEKMARTLLDVIWNQSETDPMFSNYICGSNQPYRTYNEAWRNGVIYQGWAMLGRHSNEVQRMLAITDQLIRTHDPSGPPHNVSLLYNDTVYSRVELSAILALNTER